MLAVLETLFALQDFEAMVVEKQDFFFVVRKFRDFCFWVERVICERFFESNESFAFARRRYLLAWIWMRRNSCRAGKKHIHLAFQLPKRHYGKLLGTYSTYNSTSCPRSWRLVPSFSSSLLFSAALLPFLPVYCQPSQNLLSEKCQSKLHYRRKEATTSTLTATTATTLIEELVLFV